MRQRGMLVLNLRDGADGETRRVSRSNNSIAEGVLITAYSDAFMQASLNKHQSALAASRTELDHKKWARNMGKV